VIYLFISETHAIFLWRRVRQLERVLLNEESTHVDGCPVHDVGFEAFVNFLYYAIRNRLIGSQVTKLGVRGEGRTFKMTVAGMQ
jgi:hypothetical protein